MSETEALDKRLKAATELAEAFRIERIACMSLTVLCVLVFLGCVVWGMVTGELKAATVLPMFGSGGGVAFLLGHLMRMYDRSMNLVAGVDP